MEKLWKHVLPVVIAIMLIAGMAQAGPNVRTISVFPHTHKVEIVDVPVITGVDENQCVIDIVKGQCSASVDVGSDDINPLCHWQQDEMKCVSGHWECPGGDATTCITLPCKPKDRVWVCDEQEVIERKEWGIHCDEPIALDSVFNDFQLTDEEIFCSPTNVSVYCPPESVQIDTTQVGVSYEELVTEAYVGDTIDISWTMWAKTAKLAAYSLAVFKVYPNSPRKMLDKTPKKIAVLDGLVQDETQYTFKYTGIHRLELRLYKKDGSIGRIWAKVFVKEAVK